MGGGYNELNLQLHAKTAITNGSTLAVTSNTRFSAAIQQKVTLSYTTAGTHTVTLPSGTVITQIVCAGAGGGGGGYACNEYDECRDGGSGGAGALVTDNTSYTVTGSFTVTVGSGGSAGRSNVHVGTYDYVGRAGGTGGTSSVTINGTQVVSAASGGGGSGATIDGSTHGYLGSASSGKAAGNGQGAKGGTGGYNVCGTHGNSEHYVKRSIGATAGSTGYVNIIYYNYYE